MWYTFHPPTVQDLKTFLEQRIPGWLRTPFSMDASHPYPAVRTWNQFVGLEEIKRAVDSFGGRANIDYERQAAGSRRRRVAFSSSLKHPASRTCPVNRCPVPNAHCSVPACRIQQLTVGGESGGRRSTFCGRRSVRSNRPDFGPTAARCRHRWMKPIACRRGTTGAHAAHLLLNVRGIARFLTV